MQHGDGSVVVEIERRDAFVPASVTTRLPAASKVTAKGTVPGSAFTTALDSVPKNPTRNTSMLLPFAFVVTMSCVPSGENATCPGVFTNSGRRGPVEAEGAVRAEREQCSPKMPKPCTEPPARAFNTYTRSPCTATLTGNSPYDGTTWRNVSRSPFTENTDTELLPAFTANSNACSSS